LLLQLREGFHYLIHTPNPKFNYSVYNSWKNIFLMLFLQDRNKWKAKTDKNEQHKIIQI